MVSITDRWVPLVRILLSVLSLQKVQEVQGVLVVHLVLEDQSDQVLLSQQLQMDLLVLEALQVL